MNSQSENKKILVIGSNSFSGSNFIRKSLLDGYKVYGVSRSIECTIEYIPYRWGSAKDLTDKSFVYKKIDLRKDINDLMDLIDDYKIEYVINFAAQGMVAESWLNPTHWYQTNIVAQVALHNELRKRKLIKKYVHVSTPEVYGDTMEGWLKENRNYKPSTPYAVSRAACDMHLRSFYEAYNFPVIFTRAANVYGPGQQLYRIIPKTIMCAKKNQKLTLHGGGISKRSFIHIDDVVEATLRLMETGEPGNIWHLSTNETISIRMLVEKICSVLNVDFNSIVTIGEERLGKDKNYQLDSTKARNDLNWADNVSLEEGIKGTINWINKYFDKLKDQQLEYIHKE